MVIWRIEDLFYSFCLICIWEIIFLRILVSLSSEKNDLRDENNTNS